MLIFEGKDIRLRPMEITDLEVLYEWENHPDNWEAGTNHTPLSRFFLEQYIINAQNNIYDDKQLRLIIEDRQRQAVGTIDLFDFDPHNRRAGIGILIAHPHRKKTYANQALGLILNYARKILCLRQLYCSVEENNTKSLSLFHKNGFETTGKHRQWTLRQNEWVDEWFLQCVFLPDTIEN
jgi:diamine N-acetyltransferase